MTHDYNIQNVINKYVGGKSEEKEKSVIKCSLLRNFRQGESKTKKKNKRLTCIGQKNFRTRIF